MPTSKPKTAEDNFRAAFERLRTGTPKVLPAGTPVSQNNVAKEAGCDSSALRKSRFPKLVEEIQAYLAISPAEIPNSKRRILLHARNINRSKNETINNLKAQRDDAVSRLVEADELICSLYERIRKLEETVNELLPSASVMSIEGSSKPRATPRRIK